jgi:hypothetical protein
MEVWLFCGGIFALYLIFKFVTQAIRDNAAKAALSDFDIQKYKDLIPQILLKNGFKSDTPKDPLLLIPAYCPFCNEFSMKLKLERFGKHFYCGNSAKCQHHQVIE